ncbi:MAG: bacteriohemerythrin [Thiogranum sp.]|nr:bacteriohemerythrin [Thiogranum sp.]
MNQHLNMFGISLLILTLLTAVILALMAGPANPLTWLLVAALVVIPFIHRKISDKRFMEWKSEYDVGIGSIDRQHRKLVNLINQLQTAIDYSTGEEFEREALDELVNYTKTHFSYEEGLMETHEYPDFEPHKAQHLKMIREVEAVLTEYEENQEGAMQRALDFLKDWLINHINGTDQQYSGFLRARGVE